MGDTSGALAALEEGRDLAERLVTEEPTDAVRSVLALNHSRRGLLLAHTGEPSKALESHRTALGIRQKLADADPTITSFQSDLASSHMNIGGIMMDTGKPAEALEAYRNALAIRQKLADANPAVTLFQQGLAQSHFSIGALLSEMGQAKRLIAPSGDSQPATNGERLALAELGTNKKRHRASAGL
jgi:tetratricopeptide (TPR) repeat protein